MSTVHFSGVASPTTALKYKFFMDKIRREVS